MAYLLNNFPIRRPQAMDVDYLFQSVQLQTLDGRINRDHFGDKKRVWTLSFNNLLADDFEDIDAIRNTYIGTEETITWEVTEGNYPVAQVRVHIDIPKRGFRVPGSSYLSDVQVVLTEQ